jgi:predicted TPR repeat methyltransferase
MLKPVTLQNAQSLAARGMNAAAVEAYHEYLVRFPDHGAAWNGFGLLLRRLGRARESESALAEAARCEAKQFDDPDAVQRFLAAADRSGDAPPGAPAAYVAKLFDDAAPQFESLLTGSLSYRGPELLLDATTRVLGTLKDLDILDLGCGTGLAGEVFRSAARRLDGVDLSAGMLERAAAKKVYDSLVQAEVATHLLQTPERYDLILAADVLIYVGRLEQVLAGVHRVLRPGGLFAFTAEATNAEGDGVQLQPVRRYAHSRDYLIRSASEANLAFRLLEENWIRTEATWPVRAWIGVLGADHS